MNFFSPQEFARQARATLKRRRGWALVGLGFVAWGLIILLGYACYLLVRPMIG